MKILNLICIVALVCFGATASIAQYDAGWGLQAHWKLDTASGGQTPDATGNGHTGTVAGANEAPYASVVGFDCLDFDGTLDYVTVPHHASLANREEMTVTAWVRFDEFSTARTMRIATKKWQWYLDLYTPNGTTDAFLRGHISGATIGTVYSGTANGEYLSTQGTYVLHANEWYRVALIWSEDTIGGNHNLELWVNGWLEAAASMDGTMDDRTFPMLVGASHDAGGQIEDRCFQGYIDNVKVYDQALNYERLGRSDDDLDSLRGHWKLNGEVGYFGYGYFVPDYHYQTDYRPDDPQEDEGTAHGNRQATQSGGRYYWDFDGSTDYITIDDQSYFAGEEITVTAWVKFDAISEQKAMRVVCKKWQWYLEIYTPSGTTNGYVRVHISGPSSVTVADGNGTLNGEYVSTQGVCTLLPNTWYAIGFKWSQTAVGGNNLKIYVDGLVMAIAQTEGAMSSGSGFHYDVIIGADDPSENTKYFKGHIDEVKIYNEWLDGADMRSTAWMYNGGCTGGTQTTAVDPSEPVPARLHPLVYPNPFNPQTTIGYELPMPCPVTLHVYDAAGRLVRTLRNGIAETAGRHEVVWRGRDDAGRAVASGIYIYRLEAGGLVESSSMTLIR